ncbi:FAD-dependent oxidoreductase [Sphingomonas daechungensis]|uniref:FAD-dependent oxidoreductase n=1 Tax=Sphingomonas daechungensis TaxID=1176646 RepID=UPI0037849FC5
MLIDLRTAEGLGPIDADICVMGAGAAGIPLARRLAKSGLKVCLVESGGTDFEQATQDLYRGANLGMPYYDLHDSRLRFFGGTVAIWGGRCAVLDPIDFEQRPWVEHSGWPIDRRQLDPHYRQANAIFDVGEFNYEHDVWQKLGVPDPGLDPSELDAKLWRFDEEMERFTAARARDLFEVPNVTVLLHANVTQITTSEEGRAVVGVEVRSLEGRSTTIRARRYVLACGAIENSRLLLANGIGNGHDNVGRYFMEHPAGRVAKIETREPYELWALFQKRFYRDRPPLAPALRLADDAQRKHEVLNSIVTFKLQRDPKHGVNMSSAVYNKLRHNISPDRKGRMADHLYRAVRTAFHRSVRNWFEKIRANTGRTHLYAITRGEQAPNPESRVILSGERDALGSPRADLVWKLSDIDKRTARIFPDVMDRELRRLGKGSATPTEWLSDPDPQWPIDYTVGNHPFANYHQLGGTRMSSDPAKGVVDGDCRVHGVENLYVAGGSIFPTSGWANPTLTIVALALRTADHLLAELASD